MLKTLKKRILNKYAKIFLSLSLICLIISCTVIPKNIKSNQIGFNGNDQTAGFVGFDQNGNGIITQNKLNEYNALILRYGGDTNKFLIPLKINSGVELSGVTNNISYYTIDKEHLVIFQTLKDYFREDRK